MGEVEQVGESAVYTIECNLRLSLLNRTSSIDVHLSRMQIAYVATIVHGSFHCGRNLQHHL